MTAYFQVKVKWESETNNGKTKWVSEQYLVDAMSVTEAEAKVVKDFRESTPNVTFEVTEAKASRIVKIIT